jgi:putative transposase
VLVCRELPGVNGTRVHRLWCQERLSLPRRRPRRRTSDRTVSRPIQATCPNQVWTYDFLYDACANGQRLKILTVIDEFTRESVAIEGATTLRASAVI